MIKKLLCLVLITCSVFVFHRVAAGQDEKISLLAQGKYFSVYSCKGIEADSIVYKLMFDYFLAPDNAGNKPAKDGGERLARTIDAIYSEISDVLDIHVYSFHGTLNILENQAAIEEVFKKIFDKEFNERSFYLNTENTIYISFEDLTLGMLSHEIAHAIQNSYFVVSPSTKIQEVLSAYVEFIMNKRMQGKQ